MDFVNFNEIVIKKEPVEDDPVEELLPCRIEFIKKELEEEFLSESDSDNFANNFESNFIGMTIEQTNNDTKDFQVHAAPPDPASRSSHSKENLNYRPFCCKVCDKSYMNLKDLRRHGYTHTRAKMLRCRWCKKPFTRMYNLRKHENTLCKQNIGVNLKGEQHKCGICSQSYTYKDFKVHLKCHSNEGTYKCDTCDKVFLHRSALYLHWAEHKNEKPFKCNICSKAFKMSFCLTNHMHTHSNEALNKCESCGKEFNSKQNLTNHLLVHEDKKGIICGQCNKRFNTKATLGSHKSRFHKSKN